jgi:Ca-activated chloride channel homolog
MRRRAEPRWRRWAWTAALAGCAGAALASPPLDPYEAYEAGAFETAAALFAEQVQRAPSEGGGHLNLGAALYKAGQLAAAERSFRGTLAAEPTPALAARAWYNRGNAAYRQGRLEDAIAAYEEALRRTPEDADAQHNLALARRRLAAFPPPPPPPAESAVPAASMAKGPRVNRPGARAVTW